MTEWTKDGRPFTEADAEGWIAMVYLITNLDDGRKYVGKKLLWSSKKKSVKLKSGKKTLRRVRIPSDWRSYWSSSSELQEDVKRLGPDRFKREVLMLCKSKGEVNYEELREQVERRVLFKPKEYYNSFVGSKIHRRHVCPR